jgi:hypothetical protein
VAIHIQMDMAVALARMEMEAAEALVAFFQVALFHREQQL